MRHFRMVLLVQWRNPVALLLGLPELRRERERWARSWPLSLFLMILTSVCAAHASGAEVYQDFRGGRPLLPSLMLAGPDVDAVARAEDAGLRITLPATRPVNQPVRV